MEHKKIKYWKVRVKLDRDGINTEVTPGWEWEDDEVKTPSMLSESGSAHGASYMLKVYNESEIEAAKFKCTKEVIENIENFNSSWKKVYEHAKPFIN